MSITAVVEKNTIKLPEGSYLPDGTPVRIEPLAAPATSRRERVAALRRLAGTMEGLPDDLASQHAHYLHGTPRR